MLIDLKDLKQELEFESRQGRASRSAVHPQIAATTAQDESVLTDPTTATRSSSSAEYLVGEIKKHKLGALLALAAVVLALSGLAYAIYRVAQTAQPTVAHFQQMKLTRVTSEGSVESATISPDGKYIAYSLEEDGRRSLWTKHLATDSRVQIVPPAPAAFLIANAFSPDGGYVYYNLTNEQNPSGACFQIPVLGGAARRLLTDVRSPVALSPDGKQLAFVRYYPGAIKSDLILANADGTGERRLCTVSEEPSSFGIGGGVAWSPDGKMLAFGQGSYEGGEHMELAVVSVADGALERVTSERWYRLARVAWFSDGGGVALVAAKQLFGSYQLWQVSLPDGAVRRITNDLTSYDTRSLAFTGDGRALVTVQEVTTSNLWLASVGEQGRAITARPNVRDGFVSLAWTPDGRVVYDSDAGGRSRIWMMNADGSGARPVTDGAAEDFAPEVSSDGRYIVFESLRTGRDQVWRVDLDGGRLKQLTDETGVPQFSVSPVGDWLIYAPFAGGIRKVSLEGGTPVKLQEGARVLYPQLSPDGKLIAYGQGTTLVVIPAAGGPPVASFNLPPRGRTGVHARGFHWSGDGDALDYIATSGGVSNLWRQPLDGGPAKRLIDFQADRIWNFASARDGRQILLSRGRSSADAVLISEAK